ncbi:hypothetical protein WG66_012464 [Moniliophthora roreri]|nr:hypothetical protein WG66_012464 [Moniliophthora roreri]
MSVETWISAFQSSLHISQPSDPTSSDSPGKTAPPLDAPFYPGQISTFVFLVTGYEKKLEDDTPLFFDSVGASFVANNDRVPIASGASFSVERAVWSNRGKNAYMAEWGDSVALKYVRRKTGKDILKWRQILLEIRALFHEPIRYHPNIVRLLGLSWGAAYDSGTSFPMLILELADFGTLAHLQVNEKLSFDVKKKLCYDVSKGISILHACGIVHGDLKHENVLVFVNREKDAKVEYIAKLGDFGGSVMDLEDEGGYLSMGTPPYDAPEAQNRLDAEAMKLTDVYSLGLLVWRTMLDGENPFHRVGDRELSVSDIEELKRSDQVLQLAKESIRAAPTVIDASGYELLDHTFDHTLGLSSSSRSLRQAVAALQASSLPETSELIAKADEANRKQDASDKERKPGARYISRDSLSLFIAKSSKGKESYDHQHEGPGHRPVLASPNFAEMLFDPQRLKAILDWSIQVEIFHDLEQAAVAEPEQYAAQMPNVLAAFYLFQCYCHEFGTIFDRYKACYWLRQAALSEDECEENYFAQAWCWRVHRALGVPLDVDLSVMRDWILLSVMRGHRKCIAEARIICASQVQPEERQEWLKDLSIRISYLNGPAGGIGMPYFAVRKLRREYDLFDMGALDRDIQEEFAFRGVSSIDDVYVNHRGDGLLHYAAAMGNLKALRHLVSKYNPDINLDDQAKYETPLLSACRGGHLDCALYLLDLGAAPNGGQFSEETALYWLSSFAEEDVPIIASRLVAAGAQLKNDGRRKIRLRRHVAWADHEGHYLLAASPLSRAIMMESIPAVRALLALGADPLEKLEDRSSICPVVVAAVHLLPQILEILLSHIDSRSGHKPIPIFDELEMIQIAMDLKATMRDPLSVQSRLARNITPDAMKTTLRILHERHRRLGGDYKDKTSLAIEVITRLVRLGREDLVRALLELGHSVEGHDELMIEAMKMNDESMFRLLLQYGADVHLTTSTWAEHNLIQILADRHSKSRPGLYIAEYLVERALAVNPPVEAGVRSAFASAVLRQDFILANMLLQHGADMDYSYVYAKEMVMTTVFGDLVRNPTARNVESLKYLLNVDDEGKSLTGTPMSRARPDQLPNFIVCKENQWSALHYAARYISRTDPEKQAQTKMVRLILSADRYRDGINYSTSDLGTALVMATIAANLEVVTELVEHGADVTIGVGVLTPSLALHAIFQSYPNIPQGLQTVFSNDKVSQQLIWRRFTLISELLGSRLTVQE